MDVTESSFEELVIDRSHEVPVVVDFWASWCGPCVQLAPVLEGAIAEREGAVELAKVDVDANQGLAQRFGVSGIPAVKAFRGGRVVAEFSGARSPVMVASWMDDMLAPPRAETLVEELRESGELPGVLRALLAGDIEGALTLIIDTVAEAGPVERDRLREVAVALFESLGQDDPVATAFRRRLAAALY